MLRHGSPPAQGSSPTPDATYGRSQARSAFGQESPLVEFAERLSRHRDGRIAVHVHLSRLRPHHRREDYLRLAFSAFDNIVSQREGQTFRMGNDDVVFIGPDVGLQHLRKGVAQLRSLFSEDPVAHAGDDGKDSGFATWYVLDRDYDEFCGACRRLQIAARHRATDPNASPPPRAPIDPALLAKLEMQLSGADLSNLIRNQPICAIDGSVPPSPLFHEIYVSIADLEAMLMPGMDITGNPWLFLHLTQTLDRRMLAHMGRESGERSFSMNLNVSTLLSREFLKFDQLIPSSMRGRIVIEVQKIDIFADMGAFFFARDYARERGYRLCLDGLTHLTLPFIDREKLGLDLAKLLWSPELADAENAETLEGLKASVESFGPARVILAHCDSAHSVELGRALGITLFQGRHLDALLQSGRARPAPRASARPVTE